MRELQEYERKAELLKALSHPLRLRIVHGLLTTGCHNVRCMEEKTGQSQGYGLALLQPAGAVPVLRVPASAKAQGSGCRHRGADGQRGILPGHSGGRPAGGGAV